MPGLHIFAYNLSNYENTTQLFQPHICLFFGANGINRNKISPSRVPSKSDSNPHTYRPKM